LASEAWKFIFAKVFERFSFSWKSLLNRGDFCLRRSIDYLCMMMGDRAVITEPFLRPIYLFVVGLLSFCLPGTVVGNLSPELRVFMDPFGVQSSLL